MNERVLAEKIRRYIKGFMVRYNPDATVKLDLSAYDKKNYCQEIGPNEYYIHIGLGIFEKELADGEALLGAKGLSAHEVAHALYSDYQEAQKVAQATTASQEAIPLIAEEYLKDTANEDTVAKLRDAIYGYVYGKLLFDMWNSYEDAAIEHIISADFPNAYGGLVFVRDQISKDEQEYCNSFLKTLNENSYESKLLSLVMAEIRHMATIAYRKPSWQFNFLSNKGIKKVMSKYGFTKEDANNLRFLGIHARMQAKTSTERLADAMVAMDYLKPLVDEKVDLFLNEYLTTLFMPNLDDMMMSMPGMPSHTELSIQCPTSSPMAGGPPPTSDYDMQVPPSLQKKIDNKLNQLNEEKQQGQQNQNGQSQQSQNQEQGNSDSQSSETSQESSESTQNQSSQNSESSNQSSESQNTSDLNENSENEENASAGASSENLTDEENHGKRSFDERKADEQLSKLAEEEAAKAYEATKNELKKNEKELERAVDRNFKDSVESNSSGNGKAPKQDMITGSEAGNIHQGVRVTYIPSSDIKKYRRKSYEGISAENKKKHDITIAAKFSQKLKKVLLYEAHSKIQRGTLNGKLNTAGLYRVKTDSKVFKKKEQGQEKRARFCILIDESGSMSGSKMTNAIEAAVMLASACQRIKVPVSVFGHHTRSGVVLSHYIDYKTWKKPSAIDNLYWSSSTGSNRDGLALYHSAKYLAQNAQSNEHLIMIVISDGAPVDTGYYGKPAAQDIQSMYMNFEKNYNIKTIGVGIGDDTEHIPTIYKDFIIVPNVATLGDRLLEILKNVLI